MESNGQRVAIVTGLRTPFAKQWSAYREVSALDLANIVVSELLQRVDLDPKEIQQVVYGQVVPSVEAPNIAREIVLLSREPATAPPENRSGYHEAPCPGSTSRSPSASLLRSRVLPRPRGRRTTPFRSRASADASASGLFFASWLRGRGGWRRAPADGKLDGGLSGAAQNAFVETPHRFHEKLLRTDIERVTGNLRRPPRLRSRRFAR